MGRAYGLFFSSSLSIEARASRSAASRRDSCPACNRAERSSTCHVAPRGVSREVRAMHAQPAAARRGAPPRDGCRRRGRSARISARAQATEGHGRPRKASEGQRRPAKATKGQRRPAKASEGQRRPAKVGEGRRRPARTRDGERRREREDPAPPPLGRGVRMRRLRLRGAQGTWAGWLRGRAPACRR